MLTDSSQHKFQKVNPLKFPLHSPQLWRNHFEPSLAVNEHLIAGICSWPSLSLYSRPITTLSLSVWRLHHSVFPLVSPSENGVVAVSPSLFLSHRRHVPQCKSHSATWAAADDGNAVIKWGVSSHLCLIRGCVNLVTIYIWPDFKTLCLRLRLS